MLRSAVALLPMLLMWTTVLLVGLYCWFFWTNRKLLSAASKLPKTNMKTWPIFGHSYFAFWGREEMTHLILKMSLDAVVKGLKTVCFWCGPLPLIAVHDIEDIQTVLNSSNCSDKADEYQYFRNGFDTEPFYHSLLTAPGHVWRKTRKHMNPVFHLRNLDHMVPVFNRNSRELVECLSKHVDQKDPVDLMPHTMDTALKTVCNLVFGQEIDIDIKSSDFQGLMKVVEMTPEFFVLRILRPWLRIEAVFRFVYRKELKKLHLLWNNFTDSRLKMAKEIIREKNLKATVLKNNGEEDYSSKNRQDLLNIVEAYNALQKSHPEFTEANMRYEIFTFYCTGTDTVGSATASCLLALAQFPDIQERLYQEVSSVVGVDDDVTLQDLNRMPYLDQVVKETLRWFLTVPYTLRKAMNDVKLSTCTIPAGNTIIVSLAGIHMDPKIYPDPFKFNPDRFSHDNSTVKERFAFVPFSGGPRNCIAKTYAMQLMKIMVIHIIRKYTLKTSIDISKLRKKLVVTLVSADGYNVTLENRS